MKPHKNTRRKKYSASQIKAALVCFVILAFSLNGAAAWIQQHYSKKVECFARSQLRDHGLELDSLKFRCAGFSAWNALRWKNLTAHVDFLKTPQGAATRSIQITAKTLEVSWKGPALSRLEVRAEGVSVVSDALAQVLAERASAPETLQGGRLSFDWNFTFWQPRKARKQAGALFHQLLDLLRLGKTALPLHFSASVFFEIDSAPIRAQIKSELLSGTTYLRMPVQDLIAISAVLDEGLTSREIQILSEYPILAPRLLRIRNYARTTAYQAGKRDKAVPKDAYRHVLWSYLLAREFGESFADKVTRAHEENPTVKNTPAQTEMDFNNNAIGRKYARLGYDEASLLKRLLSDPAVIRYSAKS